MPPTSFDRRLAPRLAPSVALPVLLAFTVLAGGPLLVATAPRAAAAGDEPWVRPLKAASEAQDAEIARSSAKSVASRLESQTSRNRNDFRLLYLLARAYGKDGRYADAITTYGESLAIESGCWLAWRDRGVLRWISKPPDLPGAEKDLRQAITLNPDYLAALQELGSLLIEQKRWSDGILALNRALGVDPKLDSARFQVAEAFLEMGRPNEALQTADQLLGRSPNDPRVLHLRGRILVAKGDHVAAQAIFKRLAQTNPDNRVPLVAWLEVAVKAKTLDADEGVWVLERLRRLARSKEEAESITKQIDALRPKTPAAAGTGARKGPPSASDLAAALRAPDVRIREHALLYVIDRSTDPATESFTITEELKVAIVEQLGKADDETVLVRALSLEILSHYGTEDLAGIVLGSLRDPNVLVRRKAADALARLKNPIGIAALNPYATGPDLEFAVSARRAVYLLAKQAPPPANEDQAAEVAAFTAWWTSADARPAKLAAIAAVVGAPVRFPELLVFRFAYLDADAEVAAAGCKALQSLSSLAIGDSAWSQWMRTLPALDPTKVAPAERKAALGAWYLKRPS